MLIKFVARALCLATCLAACQACVTVKPWEKAVLAKPEMSLDDNPVTSGLEDHTYFSKESSSGGKGFGGGGCGCN